MKQDKLEKNILRNINHDDVSDSKDASNVEQIK